MDQLSTSEVTHTNTSSSTTSTPHPDTASQISQEPTTTTKPLTADHLESLLQMQKTDPFCKCISRRLLNSKVPQHEFDTLMSRLIQTCHRSWKKFLALVIPKSWKHTVLMEAQDKLGHQGNSCTYCLIKCQYDWKGMNKDIRKYIANHVLCQWEKAKVQQYPLQMTEIPDRPFDKIAIDLVTECKTSMSGNKHILTIIDHLTGWPEAFPIPDKSANTIVATFINEYLPVHMCPQYILSMGQNSRTASWTKFCNSLGSIEFLCSIPPSEKWKI